MSRHDRPQQARYPNPRERTRQFGERNWDEGNWYEGRDDEQDDNPLWGRHQPRQGGRFEDRYAGSGGSEARGSDPSQRGRWREQSYGHGRYENEDHLRAGGSYGGQYDDEREYYSSGQPYSADDDTGPRDWGRSQYGRASYDRPQRGYGQPRASRSREGDYAQNRGESWRSSHEQDYDPWSYGGGAQRYGGDYSMSGTELRGQWDRGFSDMSRGTSGAYGHSDFQRGSSDQGYRGSWSGGIHRPERESFRGRGPKGYERSDERLKEIICERLMEDPNIDASEITVEVRNREVTLDGYVEDRRAKYEVEELIERCGGVKEVKNQLRVRARSSESGDERNTGSATQLGAEPSYGTSGRAGISGGTAGTSGASTSTGSSSTPSGRNR